MGQAVHRVSATACKRAGFDRSFLLCQNDDSCVLYRKDPQRLHLSTKQRVQGRRRRATLIVFAAIHPTHALHHRAAKPVLISPKPLRTTFFCSWRVENVSTAGCHATLRVRAAALLVGSDVGLVGILSAACCELLSMKKRHGNLDPDAQCSVGGCTLFLGVTRRMKQSFTRIQDDRIGCARFAAPSRARVRDA